MHQAKLAQVKLPCQGKQKQVVGSRGSGLGWAGLWIVDHGLRIADGRDMVALDLPDASPLH